MSRFKLPVEPAVIYERMFVSVTVLSSLAVLYGISLASDPETYKHDPHSDVDVPREADYWNVPDTSHNKRIFAMRASLQSRGFSLNGGTETLGDPVAGVRGVYSYALPQEELFPLEWRLVGTRCASCRPSSFLRLLMIDSPFSPEVAERLSNEWRRAGEFMPADVITVGERLFTEIAQAHEVDSHNKPARYHPDSSVEIVRRSWTDLPTGERRYELQLRQTVGQYQLDLHLMQRFSSNGAPPLCDLVLHFRWIPQ